VTRPGGEHRGDWKVAQGSKPLTIKDHVVLIINSACQGGKVCSTTAGVVVVTVCVGTHSSVHQTTREAIRPLIVHTVFPTGPYRPGITWGLLMSPISVNAHQSALNQKLS